MPLKSPTWPESAVKLEVKKNVAGKNGQFRVEMKYY